MNWLDIYYAYIHRGKSMKRNEDPHIYIGLAIFLTAFIIGAAWLITVAAERGRELENRKEACYALGNTHYWQERDQCVRYVYPERNP